YRDPKEFFHRTYITSGLRELLVGAVLRLSGQSGDPVIELQTNFGGGKTHSMLALYHCSLGQKPKDWKVCRPSWKRLSAHKLLEPNALCS
ncbi:MAG: hypothetical protein AAGJ35_07060, partial [Myxococcota bacterium]